MTKEDINNRYKELCAILGDIEVKKKGLENKKEAIFKELDTLDKLAGILSTSQVEEKNETPA